MKGLSESNVSNRTSLMQSLERWLDKRKQEVRDGRERSRENTDNRESSHGDEFEIEIGVQLAWVGARDAAQDRTALDLGQASPDHVANPYKEDQKEPADQLRRLRAVGCHGDHQEHKAKRKEPNEVSDLAD